MGCGGKLYIFFSIISCIISVHVCTSLSFQYTLVSSQYTPLSSQHSLVSSHILQCVLLCHLSILLYIRFKNRPPNGLDQVQGSPEQSIQLTHDTNGSVEYPIMYVHTKLMYVLCNHILCGFF